MEVIRHQTERETPPLLSPDDASEDVEIDKTVDVIHIDGAAVVATGENVMNATPDLLSRLARHTERRPEQRKVTPGGCVQGEVSGRVNPFPQWEGSDPSPGGRGLTPTTPQGV
jgi:hypothetical protein